MVSARERREQGWRGAVVAWPTIGEARAQHAVDLGVGLLEQLDRVELSQRRAHVAVLEVHVHARPKEREDDRGEHDALEGESRDLVPRRVGVLVVWVLPLGVGQTVVHAREAEHEEGGGVQPDLEGVLVAGRGDGGER
jgi:hypothetical protein